MSSRLILKVVVSISLAYFIILGFERYTNTVVDRVYDKIVETAVEEVNAEQHVYNIDEVVRLFLNSSASLPSTIHVQDTFILKKDILCMAENIYHEARGEPNIGQIAVGYVTKNRVSSDKFPDDICEVVKQGPISQWWLERGKIVPLRFQCQFTWWCDGKPDTVNIRSTAWANSIHVALNVLLDKVTDPTKGATYYYNYHIASPAWGRIFVTSATYGNHVFKIDRNDASIF